MGSVGATNPHIYYTDRSGRRSTEYLSLGVDHVPLFTGGRTPIDCYRDMMTSFRDTVLARYADIITEVMVSLGPAGELRYPVTIHTIRIWLNRVCVMHDVLYDLWSCAHTWTYRRIH